MIRTASGDARATTGAVSIAFLCILILLTSSPAHADPGRGRTLFINSCAACHGIDGTGASPTDIGFDVPPPDFSDCTFAPREANGDWYYVASEGGPARGFSEIMPEFGSALSDEEIISILDHIRTFCDEGAWPRGELNLPRALKATKAYPEDEMVLSGTIDPEEPGAMEFKLIWEKRIGARNQIEIIIPFGSTEQPASDGGTAWKSSLGDIGIAYKRVLLASLRKGSILSIGGELFFNTGDPDIGLGAGTNEFEPYLSYGQILPSNFHFQCHIGAVMPFDRDGTDDAVFWRLVPGYTFRKGRYGRMWSPMVELIGKQDLVSGSTADWDMIPQLQVGVNRRQHVLFCFGVRVPLNDTDVRETGYLFYLLWDWFDGALWEGW
jgi:mono/diheme cytochrome c family protein